MSSAPPATSMPHVLIIDDDEQVRRVYARTLGRDFVVECAPDVETAIEAMAAGKVFDAILCDLNLPRMKGHDLHAHLTRNAPAMARRLVIITGEEPAIDDAFTVELLRSERYLIKTCALDKLTETVRRVASPRVSRSTPSV